MSPLEILFLVTTIIFAVTSAWFYHQKSIAEIRHETELKELGDLHTNRMEEAKETIDEYEIYLLAYKKYYEQLSKIIRLSDARIKQVDHAGTFKADDEVGYFFITIKEIQETLNEFDFSKMIVKSGRQFGIPEEAPKTHEILVTDEQVKQILTK